VRRFKFVLIAIIFIACIGALAACADGVPITYSVSFDTQGGIGVAEPIAVTVGEVYGTLPTVKKDGYIFGGWFANANGTGAEVTASTIVTRRTAHTLFAKWIADTDGGEDEVCGECEQEDCICDNDGSTVCDICDNEPCVCNEDGGGQDTECVECGEMECICEYDNGGDTACVVCGNEECTCEGDNGGNTDTECLDCGKVECECEDDNGGSDTVCSECEQEDCICDNGGGEVVEPQQLSAPTGLTIVDDVLQWFAVPNAVGYIVYIESGSTANASNALRNASQGGNSQGDDNDQGNRKRFQTDNNSFKLEDYDGDEMYSVRVEAVGDGESYSNSEESASIKYFATAAALFAYHSATAMQNMTFVSLGDNGEVLFECMVTENVFYGWLAMDFDNGEIISKLHVFYVFIEDGKYYAYWGDEQVGSDIVWTRNTEDMAGFEEISLLHTVQLFFSEFEYDSDTGRVEWKSDSDLREFIGSLTIEYNDSEITIRVSSPLEDENNKLDFKTLIIKGIGTTIISVEIPTEFTDLDDDGGDTACEVCGNEPCDCNNESTVCEDCKADPCECDNGDGDTACQDCGKAPCECGNGNIPDWSFEDLDSIRNAIEVGKNFTMNIMFGDIVGIGVRQIGNTYFMELNGWVSSDEHGNVQPSPDVRWIMDFDGENYYFYAYIEGWEWTMADMSKEEYESFIANTYIGQIAFVLISMLFDSEVCEYDHETNTYNGFIWENVVVIAFENGEIVISEVPEFGTIIFKDIGTTVIEIPTVFIEVCSDCGYEECICGYPNKSCVECGEVSCVCLQVCVVCGNRHAYSKTEDTELSEWFDIIRGAVSSGNFTYILSHDDDMDKLDFTREIIKVVGGKAFYELYIDGILVESKLLSGHSSEWINLILGALFVELCEANILGIVNESDNMVLFIEIDDTTSGYVMFKDIGTTIAPIVPVAIGDKDDLTALFDYFNNIPSLTYTMEIEIDGAFAEQWFGAESVYVLREQVAWGWSGGAARFELIFDGIRQPESGYIQVGGGNEYHFAYSDELGCYVRTTLVENYDEVNPFPYSAGMMEEVLFALLMLAVSADTANYTIWSNGDLYAYMLHEDVEAVISITSVGTTVVQLPTEWVEG